MIDAKRISELAQEIHVQLTALVDQHIEVSQSEDEIAVRLVLLGNQLALTAGTTIGTRVQCGFLSEENASGQRNELISRVAGAALLRRPANDGAFDWQIFRVWTLQGHRVASHVSAVDRRPR